MLLKYFLDHNVETQIIYLYTYAYLISGPQNCVYTK